MNRTIIFSSAAGMLLGLTTALMVASGGGIPCLQGNDCVLGPGTTIGGLPAPFDAGAGGGSFDAGMLSGLFLTNPNLNSAMAWCGISRNGLTGYNTCNLADPPSQNGSPTMVINTIGGKNYRMFQWTDGAGGFAVGINHGSGYFSPSVGGCFQAAIATGSVITPYRLWVGITNGDLSPSDNDSTLNTCAFRFSTGTGDTQFVAFTANTSATSFRAFGPTVAASTLYLLTVCLNMDPVTFKQLTGPSCSFTIGDPKTPIAQTLIATTIPSSAADLDGMGYLMKLGDPTAGAGGQIFFTPDQYTWRFPSEGQ